MNSKFVPLKSGPLSKPRSTGFVPTVVSQADAKQGAPASACPAGDAAAPSLELQRDGDRVTGITLRCRCGETIQLELQ